MSAQVFCESAVEDACLSCAEEIGFQVVAGPSIAPGKLAADRTSYEEVILEGRLRAALLPKLLSDELRVKDVEVEVSKRRVEDGKRA